MARTTTHNLTQSWLCEGLTSGIIPLEGGMYAGRVDAGVEQPLFRDRVTNSDKNMSIVAFPT